MRLKTVFLNLFKIIIQISDSKNQYSYASKHIINFGAKNEENI
jgi:hypothetical protein